MFAYQEDQLVDSELGPVQTVRRACPACADDNHATTAEPYVRKPWSIKTCAGCGFVFLTCAAIYEALSGDLAWEKTRLAEAERRLKTRPVSYRLSRWTRVRMRMFPRRGVASYLSRHAKPGKVVDIGCGGGDHLLDLPDGFTPFGIEISQELAGIADERVRPHGGRVVHAPALDGLRELDGGSFTAATLRSYLEHEAQPLSVLKEVGRVLCERGTAVVKVPNFACLNRRLQGAKWCGFRTPDHVNYFTPGSLRAMAEAAGFSCRFGLFGALPTSDNMWAVLTRR